MARIVVYSMAYRGDVFPFVPIASELARRGHDVVFVSPRELHASFAAEPFECRDADAGDLTPTGLDRHGDYTARWGRVLSGALLLRLYFARLTIPRLPELLRAVDDALDGADLLLSHPAASLVGRIACEKRGIPWVVGDLFPMLVPTETHPPQGIRLPSGAGRVTRALNRHAWSIARSPLGRWASSERDFARFRAEHGLPTERGYAILGRLSPHLDLALVSPHYYPPCPDWPDHYRTVGFTRWTASTPELPDEVEQYLAAGDPPILVTLGTSAASGNRHAFPLIAETLAARGERGLFLTSLPPAAVGLGDHPGAWQYLPLEPLLPRCRAAVHSGSHGSNALILAAGLPSVVLPHLFDQVWHAQRQEEIGSGVHVARLSARRLGRAIDRVTRDDTYAREARSFASLLAGEDGTGAAADALEAFLRRGG